MNSGVMALTPGEQYAVNVGKPGTGASESRTDDLIGNTDGGESSFSNLLVAERKSSSNVCGRRGRWQRRLSWMV